MTLRLLKPSLHYMRSALPMSGPVREHETVERLRGGALRIMRHRVLARSAHLCECDECRSGYPRPLTWDTFELDHITRVADGGDNSIANFRAVHLTCHARITARQNAEVARYGCTLPAPPVQGRPLLKGTQGDEDMPC